MTLLSDHARTLLPGRGPLLSAADPHDGAARRRLERAWTRGVLVRLCPRVYITAGDWAALRPWDRAVVSAVALSIARPETVFTGLTAARLHGLGPAVEPPALELRAPSAGHHGAGPLTRRPFAPSLVAHDRRLPVPPRRRPRWGLPEAAHAAPQPVEAVLSDGQSLGTVLADPLPTVLLVLGAATPFRDAVAPLDALVRARPEEAARWARQAESRLGSAAALRRFERAWHFADARAESAGESYSRAILHELGFVPPTALQHRHRDANGREVARTDFWWEQVRVYGEFDGLGKYDLSFFDGDDTARRASIRREKEREVALQLVTRAGAHWTWGDLLRPDRLARILTAAGVPRSV